MKKTKAIISLLMSFLMACQGLVLVRPASASGAEGPLPIGYYDTVDSQYDIRELTATHLAPDGMIHIKFDSGIKLTTADLTLAKLYGIPKISQQNFDDGTGTIIDREYKFSLFQDRFVPEAIAVEGQGYDNIERIEGTDELPIGSITVADPNAGFLCIKPQAALDYHAKYRLVIDRSLISSTDDVLMANNIDFTFWTASSPQGQAMNWAVGGVAAGSITPNTVEGYQAYTVNDTPIYSPTNPIILNIDQEVFPKAIDSVLQSEPVKITSISFDALKEITLTDMLTEAGMTISTVQLYTYSDNGVKKSRLMLYPALMNNGNPYKLTIPSTALETRSGTAVPNLQLILNTQADPVLPRGITSISPMTAKVTDFYWENGSFTIKGYNFSENINRVALTRLNSASVTESVYIEQNDIVYVDHNNIIAHIRGANAATLSLESSVGQYGMELYFSDGAGAVWAGTPINIISKGRPIAENMIPDPNQTDVWYDESSSDFKFVKVIFDDIDGQITIKDFDAIRNSTIYAQGSALNLLNTQYLDSIAGLPAAERDAYVLTKDRTNKKAYLNIPIQPLRPQTRYDVTVAPNIVGFEDIIGADNLNLAVQWSFTTMGIPTTRGMAVGTVSENYNEDEPIYIEGSTFYKDVTVYFNDIKAERVRVLQNDTTGEYYLEVFLPEGTDRLEPGLYDVIIQNDKNHKTVIYGGFSVVTDGEYVPNEQYKVIDDIRQGQIRGDLKISEDTLLLESEYVDDNAVSINLDKRMGDDVLVRKIQFKGKAGAKIGTLSTESKWADVIFSNLRLDTDTGDRQVMLELGRAQPQLMESIKQKIRGRPIKSEFIQATGKNFIADGITLVIPFKDSDGKNIKVLRYDEKLRNLYSEDVVVNYVDRTVRVNSQRPGIFVVVE